jgi:hypothetical protein
MKKTKTLFDQAIEIIEEGKSPLQFLHFVVEDKQVFFFRSCVSPYHSSEVDGYDDEDKYFISLYTRLLLARELWNDGQEKYWKQGLFK